MAKANRETLKGYFKSGRIPTEEQFEALIDSMLNIVDDGMNKSAGNGLQLSPLGEGGNVLQFFGNILDRQPLWTVRIDNRNGNMEVCRGGEEERRMIFRPGGEIEVQGDLLLKGKIEARAFIGNYNRGETEADGQWHDITCEPDDEPAGCRAYRVMAGCGKKGEGRYALLESTAMHCYGNHRKIRGVQSWFGRHFNRLRLRWNKHGDSWRLQIRSRCDYGEGVKIRFQVTELWQDYFPGHPAE